MLWERYPQFHERTTFSTLDDLLEEHERVLFRAGQQERNEKGDGRGRVAAVAYEVAVFTGGVCFGLLPADGAAQPRAARGGVGRDGPVVRRLAPAADKRDVAERPAGGGAVRRGPDVAATDFVGAFAVRQLAREERGGGGNGERGRGLEPADAAGDRAGRFVQDVPVRVAEPDVVARVGGEEAERGEVRVRKAGAPFAARRGRVVERHRARGSKL